MDFSQPNWLENWPSLEQPNAALLTDWNDMIPGNTRFETPVDASTGPMDDNAQPYCDQWFSPARPGDMQASQTGFMKAFWSLPPSLQPARPSGAVLSAPFQDVPQQSSKFPQSLAETVRCNLQSVGHSNRCTWPKCNSSEVFMGLEAIKDHLVKAHVSAVQGAWPGCKWPDCESKKGSFTTAPRLWDHIQNIHIEPLICPERDCSHKKAFGKHGDLDRHHKSKHSDGSLPFKCTRPSCPKPINGFARRDKLKEHLRNWHGAFECVFPGCRRGPGNGFKTQEQLDSHGETGHRGLGFGCPLSHCQTSNTSEASIGVLLADHIAAIHGDYNCELGICGTNPASKFIPYTLKKHLITDHDVMPSEAVELVDSLIKAGECALKDTQLARLGWAFGTRDSLEVGTSKTFIECRSCLLIESSTSESSE